jgi:uncharacterized protein (TIGR03435 family)
LFILAAVFVTALLPSARCAQAQASAGFDVASIRPAKSARPLNSPDLVLMETIARGSTHGRFQLEGVPVSVLIQLAYDVRDFQVQGLPGWAAVDEFDVNARTDEDEDFEQMRFRLQMLLGDRFGLRLHRDIRELPVYEMEVSKSGLKILPEKDGGCLAKEPGKPAPPFVTGHPTPLHVCGGVRVRLSGAEKEIEAIALTMPKLAGMLSKEVSRSVIDETGFTQPFDLRLHFVPEDGSNRLAPPMTPVLDSSGSSTSVSIFTALQEQLGLRLQAARGPVQVLVIEHVGRPTPN